MAKINIVSTKPCCLCTVAECIQRLVPFTDDRVVYSSNPTLGTGPLTKRSLAGKDELVAAV